jgi:hypothetical protein
MKNHHFNKAMVPLGMALSKFINKRKWMVAGSYDDES